MVVKYINGKAVPLAGEELAEYEAAQAANAEASRIAGIKRKAYALVIGRYPEWKQRNMNMEAIRLNKKLTLGTATPEDEARIAELEVVADWIDAVRAHSDALEADPELAEDWPA